MSDAARDRFNHLMDTVAVSKFLVTLIDESGMRIVFDALETCGVHVPFMEAMVESEYTMFQHEMGTWYHSKCKGILITLIIILVLFINLFIYI